MGIHGRQGFGRWSFPLFYYAVAQTPIRALRIKHFRKAGRKNEYKEETGRQELAETGGRTPLQGYRCAESRQPVLEELYHDPDSKLHAQGQKGGVTMPDTNMERERERNSPQVLVDTENLTREEWLDWRRRGIGGSMISLYKKISTRKDVKILETLIMAGHQFCLVVPSRINRWAMLFCCQNMGRCTTTNARYLLRMAGILK